LYIAYFFFRYAIERPKQEKGASKGQGKAAETRDKPVNRPQRMVSLVLLIEL
jgi:hypothetical protein